MGPTVRLLTEADGPALLEVDRQCPIQAGWRFHYDRSPDFFAWPGIVMAEHAYLGAFLGSRLVGYGMAASYPGSSGAPVLYVGDGRVLPAYRRHGVARALLAAGPGTLARIGGPDHGWALVAGQNAAARRVAQTWAVAGFEARLGAPVRAHTVPVRLPIPPLPASVRVHPAGADAAEVLVWAHRRHNATRPLARDLDVAQVRRWLRVRALHGVLVARRGPQVVGAAGLWDPAAARRLVLDGWPRRWRPAASAIRSLAHGTGRPAPRIVTPGAAIPAVTLSPQAAADADVLRALVLAAVRWARATGRLAVHAATVDGEPAERGMRGIPRLVLRSDVVMIDRAGTGRLPSHVPPCVDLAVV